ncbi:hypothetical protein [Azonexus hydrophilus]|uniref:Uncharacterized protein n=1 Tax=Azonexus hydrophilus TaxID=418702 RepID=A0ABZ2XN95_9RHOO
MEFDDGDVVLEAAAKLFLIGLSFIVSAGALYWTGSNATAALAFCVFGASAYFAMAKRLNKIGLSLRRWCLARHGAGSAGSKPDGML